MSERQALTTSDFPRFFTLPPENPRRHGRAAGGVGVMGDERVLGGDPLDPGAVGAVREDRAAVL
ncbi:hypothetical protein ABZ114_30615, partial [Streptomyces albidoflavus]|uniref:hypothetical protein n=1 Tax=Streptomyces albidoflavus TaxID=1886 RepID=UPI0033A94F04